MRDSLYGVRPGSPMPLGALYDGFGVNFAIFSRNAKAVTLRIFAAPEDGEALFEYRLDPVVNRTGDIWHCRVQALAPGALYLYRVEGPYEPRRGHRFNPAHALLDPYAKALTCNFIWDLRHACDTSGLGDEGPLPPPTQDDAAFMPKCVVVSDAFDWEGDRPLNYPLRHCVLYETHVRGLTMHQSAGVKEPGTYLGVIEKIPYFKDLGITSLEFLPVQEYDEFEILRKNPKTGESLQNYWGYSTIAFFAPKGSYCADLSLGAQVREFKTMVRELHKAGLEVILDIVFNHTGEGNELGPTISFRGIDNAVYYMLEEDKRRYRNFSGCGNTLNCNHPVVRSFIMDCLRYWVVEMHVDGFRFDLGSILGRDQQGRLLENPPVIEQIAEDPILRNTKIIAEAWDAGGAYQVGGFPGGRWAEWNDRFRDDTRRFWRGDAGMIQHLATRIAGSSDLYLRDGRKPFHSINYITSHDGFTLRDLVSYNGKRNEENGETNEDGHNSNYSYNYGFEGETSNASIAATRLRQQKNFLATLLLSIGVPMVLGGDELGRSQRGNNNAYCQNNEISWIDWGLKDENSSLFRLARELIRFRLRHPTFRRPEFFTGKDGNFNAVPDIAWFDERGKDPDWASIDGILAARLDGSKADVMADRDSNDFFILFNATKRIVPFVVCPSAVGSRWYRVLDTARESPGDFLVAGEEEILVPQAEYVLRPRSVALLLSKPT